jgi:L-lactate dehydrogenase complex protein LldG
VEAALMSREQAPPVRLRIPEMDPEARVESLLRNVEALAGKTCRAASPGEARAYVAGVLEGKTAVASNAPFLRECGITELAGVRSDLACATAAAGITSADYALADTGTLVLLSSAAEARLISLLPPMHIAVLPKERVLTGLDELFTVLPNPAAVTSSMVLITGPSRTADIEQILIRGVHGPGEVYAVIVESA